jgi:uncharacterized protein (DUF58 family)
MDLHWRELRRSSRYQGSHVLNLKRVSKDTLSSRPYVAGDPVRMIDWKAFGKTDQLLVREVRDEASVRVRISISCHETMFWPDQSVQEASGQKVPQKWEVALRCAFAVAAWHLCLGDQVLMFLVSGSRTRSWSPRVASDLVTLFAQLSQSGFARDIAEEVFSEQVERSHSKPAELGYVFSDLLDPQEELIGLAGAKKSFVFHILSHFEAAISWLRPGWTCFDDSLKRKEFQSEELFEEQAYERSIHRWMTQLRDRFRQQGTRYNCFNEQTLIREFWDAITAKS